MSTVSLPLSQRFAVCLRRKEAVRLCAELGITRRTFEAWCLEAPAMPEGLRFRRRPGCRVTHIYSRDGIIWLAQHFTTQEKPN